MQPPRPTPVQFATLHFVPDAPAPIDSSLWRGRLAAFLRYVMNAPSFLKRLVRSVVRPAGRRLAGRRAQAAIELCHALISERGEVSGAVLARDALTAYNDLNNSARAAFFDRLVAEFGPDQTELD